MVKSAHQNELPNVFICQNLNNTTLTRKTKIKVIDNKYAIKISTLTDENYIVSKGTFINLTFFRVTFEAFIERKYGSDYRVLIDTGAYILVENIKNNKSYIFYYEKDMETALMEIPELIRGRHLLAIAKILWMGGGEVKSYARKFNRHFGEKIVFHHDPLRDSFI